MFESTIITWVFLKTSIFLIKCAPFLFKIEGLNIDDLKAKALEIDKFHLKMHLNIFVSNVFLTLKIMNYNKTYSFCVI